MKSAAFVSHHVSTSDRWSLFLACATAILVMQPAYSQNPDRLDELVVTASTMPIEPEKVGSAVSVITAEDLQIQGTQYAADALRHVPGVAVNRAGSFGGLTQVRLRGAEGNHVLVLIDGVEVAGSGSGEFDFSSLLASGVARIEVLRGPQSGLYGANAMAGVINVITASGAGGSRVDVSAEAGSFDSMQTSVSARGGNDRRHGAITVAYRNARLDVSEFGNENDEDENLSLVGRGTLGVSAQLALDGGFRVTDKHSELDGFDFSGGPDQGLSIDTADFADTVDAQISGGATWSLRDGGWVTRLSGNYFQGEVDGGGTSIYGSETTREQLALTSTVELDTGSTTGAHFVSAFIQHEDETYRNRYPFDPSQLPELERGILGVGFEYRGELHERLYVSGAVRNDSNDGFQDATTYRLTAAYLVNENGTRLHTSYGSGVTNPTFFEQFGFVPGTFVGNPNLEPEEVEGWDVGVEQRFADGRLAVDITFFAADLEDEIASLFPTVVNDAGTSKRQGIELAFDGQLGERLSLSA
ncbi:MAG TPA: TonB-dependent receptor, partial [Gammaproteobacteria bacterium]|nr:TonB-dependent receptor [Gammaproteobacteria bacterium]